MSNIESFKKEPATPPVPWIWTLTLTVAGLPVLFGLYQIWIFFDEAFPHLYWSRTLPALAAVALGLAGVTAPLWVFVKRRKFCHWPRARQWKTFAAVLLLMLVAYLVPFVLLVDAARSSRAILSYTPAVFLLYSPEDDERHPLRFGVVGGPGTGSGGSRRNHDLAVVEWNAWLEPKELARPPGPDPVVQLRAEGKLDADPIQVEVTIETGRKVRFDTRGLANPRVRRDGQLVTLPIELNAGMHRLTVEQKGMSPIIAARQER